eukprot:GFUD01018192.1.p1 GENE.GFUD01018192.1~~GFUD01018192.1.p1  ORF type:complete len:582 (+),score=169.37 GFUD01018192.1:145-1890(+)
MEEGERRESAHTAQDQNRLSGFADQLASCLLKETISEAGGGEEEGEQIWSIPCSSECHSHRHERVSTSSSGRVRGSGQLCWTPESSGSLDNTMEGRQGGHNTCRGGKRDTTAQSEVAGDIVEVGGEESGEGVSSEAVEEVQKETGEQDCQSDEAGPECELAIQRLSLDVSEAQEGSDPMDSPALRKGLSVPDVGLEDMHDRVSFGSENSKSYKLGFLRHLGLKRSKTETTDPSGRKRMKSLRKTLSSLFHLKSKLDAGEGDESGEGREAKPRRPTSAPSIFRLPTRKPKNILPCQRALPPVPGVHTSHSPPQPEARALSLSSLTLDTEHSPPMASTQATPRADTEADNIDFAASIEKVKDHGWYWGPLSGESAERILSGEPDGSFVVRDSSDHHYIFSLTFKLNGFVRHVRIEHDQGNFSFGSFTKFKSNTIVDFIENAVEHSRSGRYLFFLHRRPVLGPMRVQLLHPVSRFKRVQSLQHLCRYIIVKHVRKDHLDQLPVPSRIKNYLNTPFYYSEQVTENEEAAETSQTLEQIEENVINWDRDMAVAAGDLNQWDSRQEAAQYGITNDVETENSESRTTP